MTSNSQTSDERILSADPNPVPGGPAPGSTTIRWTSVDGTVGEVYVSRDDEPERLFARGRNGAVDAPWIQSGSTYRFRLYSDAQHRKLRDELVVTRAKEPWEASAEEVLDLLRATNDQDQGARTLAAVLQAYLKPPRYPEYFRLWEAQGLHVTRVHFYSPVPDTGALPDSVWDTKRTLCGIDLNESLQLELLNGIFPKFRTEYSRFPSQPTDRPHEFHFGNGRFDGMDALALYCMVRHHRPKTIVEIGSGYSSRISARAAVENGDTRLICIEPYPDDVLKSGFPGLHQLIVEKAQDVPPSFFDRLEAGDILFIDSSHVSSIGSDVNYIILHILPRLKPGVIVHFHDIFIPYEYPKNWVLNRLCFWNEQYLLQAFLTCNPAFEVLLANHYLGCKHRDVLQRTFPRSPWLGGASFWIRRRSASAGPRNDERPKAAMRHQGKTRTPPNSQRPIRRRT